MEHPTHSMIKNDNPVKGTETLPCIPLQSKTVSSGLRMITPLRGRKPLVGQATIKPP